MGTSVYKNSAGKRIPSVTTIIGSNLGWNKRTLINWYSKMFREGRDPDQIVEEACDIGTLTHLFIEHHIYGDNNVDVTGYDVTHISQAAEGLQAYIKWEKENDVKYLESELSVSNEQYGGTIDSVAIVKGKMAIIDFKTSSSVYAEHIIQLSAYHNLISDKFTIENFVIVNIKKGEVLDNERVCVYNIDSEIIKTATKTFLSLLELHETEKVIKKWVNSITGKNKKKGKEEE